MTEKFLVLGGTGFLGSYFSKALGSKAVVHTSLNSKTQDSRNLQSFFMQPNEEKEIRKFIKKQDCDTVINCVALTSIEKCELNPDLAHWMNSILPATIAEITKSLGIKFVHMSTDAVFDDTKSFKTETDPPSPISTYGKTKALGESLISNVNHESLIARVNFFGRNRRQQSLFDYFYQNLLRKNHVPGFSDVYFTPIFAQDLVDTVLNLITLQKNGIFHVVGDERISKYDFGILVSEVFGLSREFIFPASIKASELSQSRSTDLSLSNVKIKTLGMQIPSIRQGLTALKSQL